jgi:putative aldouronate transport system permease protein
VSAQTVAGSEEQREASSGPAPAAPVRRTVTLRQRIWRERWMYTFIAPGALFFVVFAYVPMLGNVVAFQDFSPFRGFSGSPWVGFANFQAMIDDPEVVRALRNTLIIALLQLVFAFPAPIALALLLDSLMSNRVRRMVQTVVYLPHFLSWVIVISVWQQVLGGGGFVNDLLRNQGADTINVMNNPDIFVPLVVLQWIWKEVGWGTIIFLAALSKVDPQLYEASAIDGASGWRRLWHVTLPSIRGIIILLLILRLGNMMTVGFEQFFLQRGAVGANAAEVLDTFVYFRGVVGGDWGLAAAAGLLRGIFGTIMIITANRLAKRFFGEGLY